MVWLVFSTNPYWKNANKCMNSVLKPSNSTYCESLSEIAEKRRTAMTKQQS